MRNPNCDSVVPHTVLLVDDDDMACEAVKFMLQTAGFRVLTASNGRDGIRLCQKHGPELTAVLLDMTMPGLCGDQVLIEVRRQGIDVPVIFMSGYDAQDRLRSLDQEGVSYSGFLLKPYTMPDLLSKLYEIQAP